VIHLAQNDLFLSRPEIDALGLGQLDAEGQACGWLPSLYN
jgi:hypothetical protein